MVVGKHELWLSIRTWKMVMVGDKQKPKLLLLFYKASLFPGMNSSVSNSFWHDKHQHRLITNYNAKKTWPLNSNKNYVINDNAH